MVWLQYSLSSWYIQENKRIIKWVHAKRRASSPSSLYKKDEEEKWKLNFYSLYYEKRPKNGVEWYGKRGKVVSWNAYISARFLFPVGNLHPSASLSKQRTAVASSSEELQLVLMAFFPSHCILPKNQPNTIPPPSREKYVYFEILLEEDECCFVRELLFFSSQVVSHTPRHPHAHPLAKCPISFGVVQVLLNDVEEIFKLGSTRARASSSTEKNYNCLGKNQLFSGLSVLWICQMK